MKFVDAGLFCFGFWLAHFIRSKFLRVEIFGGTADIQPFSEYLWLLLVVFMSTPLLLEMQGFYSRPLIPSRRRTAWQLLKACGLSLVTVIFALFLFKQLQLARAVPFIFGATAFGLMFLKEELVRQWLKTTLGQSQLRRRFILAGTREDTMRLRDELKQTSDDLEIVAQLDLNQTSVEHLVDLLHKHSANGVILSAQHMFFGQIEKAIQACELEGVEAWLMADFFKTQISQTSLDDLYGRPMLVFRSTPEESWQNLAKQMMDVVGAFCALALLGIPLLIIAALIKLTSPGPVLFRQQRSGLNGRPFTMLKFRSMVTNAEQLKQELEALNEMSGPVFKVTNDPRVTPIGRFLRRYSVDEFPQLINVLRGEMSLVGPRPLPVDEVQRFDDLAHRRRLSVKPGLTCLWQVSGRNNVRDFKDWVRLDLEYIDNWSLWLDLKILVRTIPVVVLGTGAK
ncbi:MAG: sugar transferase [Verrucomicrobiota bacterium]